ncbi:MAG: hypothetical protein JW924_00040 [Fusobacteriaceae bacterium]|nr:hypothetical protein [Fusobacteriaceae bacterium]
MTLEEAKAFFKEMNYSLFSMAREDLERYEKYKRLKISKEIENRWREEEFYIHLNIINKNIENKRKTFEVWNSINIMSELIDNIKDINLIKLIYKLIVDLSVELSIKDKIIIAEIIIGRKNVSCRSGLIFLSYDLNDRKLPNCFFQLTMDLLNIKVINDEDNERLKQNIEKCMLIKKELNL